MVGVGWCVAPKRGLRFFDRCTAPPPNEYRLKNVVGVDFEPEEDHTDRGKHGKGCYDRCGLRGVGRSGGSGFVGWWISR